MMVIHKHRLTFQPHTYYSLQRGVNTMVSSVRPTLGPLPRLVAVTQITGQGTPVLLDNGGEIVRQIIELSDPDEDMGAMIVRDCLWRLQLQVGDGTATAAVLFQSVFDQAIRYIFSGGNAMRLQACLHKGMEIILADLNNRVIRLEGKEQLAQLAQSICYDPPLANLIGEIFDVIGEFGRVEIREGRSRDLEREYIEGMYWDRGLVSREMITDNAHLRTDLEEAAILISDLDIEDPRQLLPSLAIAIDANIKSFLILANKFSEATIGFLVANKNSEKFRVIAVQTPGVGEAEQAIALQDLAILTGGRALVKAASDTFTQIRVQDFGTARRAWADTRNFGIIGGKGDARALRQHIATLRQAFDNIDDPIQKEKLRERIGKMLGGSATLWVGGITEKEIKARTELAERTGTALRSALLEGVLPGGGASLLACRPALQRAIEQSVEEEEQVAYRILLRALEEPTRTIALNAGHDDRDVMAQIKMAGDGFGFDALQGKIILMDDAGIYDPAAVVKSCVFAAISAAAMALTIDTCVYPMKPEQAPIPRRMPQKRL